MRPAAGGVEQAQLLNYLKAAGFEVGLIVICVICGICGL